MEPLTAGAIAIGTVIATKVLEKTGEKVGESLWDKTGKFLVTLRKHSPHTVVAIEKAPEEPLDYGKAVLEVESAAKAHPEVNQAVQELVAEASANPPLNLAQVLQDIAQALKSQSPQNQTEISTFKNIINFAKDSIQFDNIPNVNFYAQKSSIRLKKLFVEIPVFFATDRDPTDISSPEQQHYGEQRNKTGNLEFGLAKVSIPDDHRRGHLEQPKWWKLEFKEDPNKHVMVLNVETFGQEKFLTDLRESLKDPKKAPDLLIFIHGYNTSFEDALRRTAQITYDQWGVRIGQCPFVGAIFSPPLQEWSIPHVSSQAETSSPSIH